MFSQGSGGSSPLIRTKQSGSVDDSRDMLDSEQVRPRMNERKQDWLKQNKG
jgi:hypothetical protein